MLSLGVGEFDPLTQPATSNVSDAVRFVGVGKIRTFVGDLVEDDELYVSPGLRMPTLAGALVVQARQRTGLTQAGLAERAGTSRSAISSIEHGKRDPGLEGLQKILRAAGFDLHARLAPHDDHDDTLKALGAHLTPDERKARSAAALSLYDEARAAMAHSRPLLPR